MMQAMYARFANEQPHEPYNPPPFSMLKYQKEIERLERAYNPHFNTLWNMVSKAKFSLMQRLLRDRRLARQARLRRRQPRRRGLAAAVMSPLESQVREHHLQLRRRLESIKRIHVASGELDILNKYGALGVTALSNATPADTGVTAHSWSYTIVDTPGYSSIRWHNSNVRDGIPIVVLLQYGHGTGRGGFVQGRDFIMPAIRPLFDQITEEVWKEVTRV